MNKKKKTVKCCSCGREYVKTTSNCCWISCECGMEICGNCGSDEIRKIPDCELDLSDGSDDNYWCCKYCSSCDMRGCAMCV